MGKNKKAKSEKGELNIDAAEVKKQFVHLATEQGLVLTSNIPQMKDLGPDGYRYTMWGVNKHGNRCLVVLSADRDGISQKENWQSKYPAMKTVTGDVVAIENQRFAAKRIVNLCAGHELSVMDKTARPVEIPFGTSGMHYGYAMCAAQGEKRGFVTMENGANAVSFTEVTPKFL
jgi:hypothetical protein